MSGSSHAIKAFLYALIVCGVAIGGFWYLWFELELPFLRTEAFLLGAVFFGIALLAVTVYQSIRISATASSMAKGMAESMLIYSRELFTELYRGSPVPYLVIDSGLTVDSANLAAVRLFGVEEGWLPGKKVFDFITGDDEHRVALIAEYFKQRVAVNGEEVMIVRRDGTERWVMLSLFSFTDANRKHKGLLTLVDVTKQKEIDKAKTEFVSLASHQLRTPISAMKWNIELLNTSGTSHFTETEREYVEKIGRGVTRMENLVADFLSVSKLELGTLVPKFETISFDDFMGLILESYEKIAEARNIRIERSWNAHDTVRSDVHLLEMAVSNLISNAVKYTPDDGTVKISLESHDRQYVIVVSDTGIGIPEDEQDRVFSKIFRASNAKIEVPDGTGLGLYIVREAIRVMGGDVTFVSKQGSGTTFTVTLPS
jgi:two-component system phosphate regulon sensor histidine kinase PhoR